MPFPNVTIPPETRYSDLLDKLQRFFTASMKFWRGTTDGDFTLTTGGKGIVMTNAAGTVTKRVRLNNAGNGLIYEDV